MRFPLKIGRKKSRKANCGTKYNQTVAGSKTSKIYTCDRPSGHSGRHSSSHSTAGY